MKSRTRRMGLIGGGWLILALLAAGAQAQVEIVSFEHNGRLSPV